MTCIFLYVFGVTSIMKQDIHGLIEKKQQTFYTTWDNKSLSKYFFVLKIIKTSTLFPRNKVHKKHSQAVFIINR